MATNFFIALLAANFLAIIIMLAFFPTAGETGQKIPFEFLLFAFEYPQTLRSLRRTLPCRCALAVYSKRLLWQSNASFRVMVMLCLCSNECAANASALESHGWKTHFHARTLFIIFVGMNINSAEYFDPSKWRRVVN